MSDLRWYFLDGGEFMYVIAALALGCVPVAIVALAMHAKRFRAMGCVWVGLGASVLVAGSMGTFAGLYIVDNAVAFAAPDEKQMMLAMGLSVSLYTESFARLAAGLCLPLIAAGIAVGHLIGTRGEQGRWTILPGVGGGSIALLGAMASIAWGAAAMSQYGSALAMAGGGVALLCAFILAGVGLREDVDEQRHASAGGARAAAWLLCLLGVWAMSGLARVSGTVIAFKAVATAAPEEKATMMRHGIEIATRDARPGTLAVVGVLLAGGFLLIPLAKSLKGALPIAGAIGLISVVGSTVGVSTWATSRSVGQIDGLLDEGPDTPAQEAPSEDLGMEPLGG